MLSSSSHSFGLGKKALTSEEFRGANLRLCPSNISPRCEHSLFKQNKIMTYKTPVYATRHQRLVPEAWDVTEELQGGGETLS